MRSLLSKFYLTLLWLIAIAIPRVHGQEAQDSTLLNEVVITGTRIETSIEKSGKSIHKISRSYLDNHAGKHLGDLLNEVSGIQIDGNYSNPGSNMSIYLRGGRNHQVLILIDGIPINDPSGISLSFDIRNLTVDQIESIEILKGSLSSLYGSGAVAGVINIILKKAEETPLAGMISAHAGSFGTFGQNLQLSGQGGKFNYLVSGTNLSTQGLSAALDETDSGDFDKDGFKRKNGLIKLGYKLTDYINLRVHAGYDGFEVEYDNDAFIDGNNLQKVNQFHIGLDPEFKYKNGQINLKTILNSNVREFESDFPSKYRGRNLQFDLTNKHQFSTAFTSLVGLNIQKLSYEEEGVQGFSEANFNTIDPFVSLIYDAHFGLNIHASVRMNNHSEYGSNFIYNLNPSYIIDLNNTAQLKLLANVSTSFITPSLYQYYSIYGNRDLQPEQANNLEFGFAIYADEKFEINGNAFNRNETDPLGFESLFDDDGNYIGGRYVNTVDERYVRGFELDMKWQFFEKINFSAQYSYAESDDSVSFYRIPARKIGVNLTYSPIPDLNFSLNYLHSSERLVPYFDLSTFSTVIKKLEPFGIVDFSFNYSLLNNKLAFRGAINNLLDNDFTELYGFTTKGRNFDVGVVYQF